MKKSVKISSVSDAVAAMLGMKISHVWRGNGSAIFLELGKTVTRTRILKNGKKLKSRYGRFSVMIEWGWRIEKMRSIYAGSSCSDIILNNRIKKLEGETIDCLSFDGRIPELYLKISGGYWLRTCSMCAGSVKWVIFERDPSGDARCWYTWENGSFVTQAG
jgi:hypothetical protein